MPTYVALVRGINVGRAKRVAMTDLRALFTNLGYGDVQTVLRSGNVVFSTAGPLGWRGGRPGRGCTALRQHTGPAHGRSRGCPADGCRRAGSRRGRQSAALGNLTQLADSDPASQPRPMSTQPGSVAACGQ